MSLNCHDNSIRWSGNLFNMSTRFLVNSLYTVGYDIRIPASNSALWTRRMLHAGCSIALACIMASVSGGVARSQFMIMLPLYQCGRVAGFSIRAFQIPHALLVTAVPQHDSEDEVLLGGIGHQVSFAYTQDDINAHLISEEHVDPVRADTVYDMRYRVFREFVCYMFVMLFMTSEEDKVPETLPIFIYMVVKDRY